MTAFEQVAAVLAAVVPSGKVAAWLIAGAVSVFMAGVGVTLNVSDFSDLPETVETMQITVDRNETNIRVLRIRADSATANRKRILCLVTLTATGEEISPLEVNARCP